MHSEPTHADTPAMPADALGSLMMPPGYIAALDADGQIVALPTDHLAAPDTTGNGIPAASEAERASLPPVIAQVVVLGSVTLLAGSGALWIAAAALRAAHPVLPDAVACLKWSAVLVAFVVAGVFTAKVRSHNGGSVSVFHTTKTTTVGSQTVRGRRNSVNNHF